MQRNQLPRQTLGQPLNSPYSPSNRIVAPKYYGATSSDHCIRPGTGARTLISAGMLVLTVWAISIFSEGNAYSDTSPSRRVSPPVADFNISSAQYEDAPLELPPLNRKVVCSALGMYHWQRDCPLDGGTSVRLVSQPADDHRKEQRLTRHQAELENYYPCLYCAEIKDWRARKFVSGD